MALTKWSDILHKPNGINDVQEIALTVDQLSSSILSINEDIGELAGDVQEIALEISQLSASVLPMSAEDPTTIKDNFKAKLIHSIAANEYTSFALAFAALETYYDNLSNDKKLKALIVTADKNIYHNMDIYEKRFGTMFTNATSIYNNTINLKNHSLTGSTITTTITHEDYSSDAQTAKLDLYVLI